METHQISKRSLSFAGVGKAQGHKFSHGAALVVSGGAGRTGAARLAARGALRIGAGLVTLAVPPAAVAEVAAQITALMMRRIDGPAGLADLLRDDRITALCIGPGLGLDEGLDLLVALALDSDRPVVLDADALNLLAQDRGLFAALHDRCVLTPHGGEFARLFPDISERLAADPPLPRSEAARAAARRAGCIVVLKGAESIVARPDGVVGIHRAQGARAVPWLATAGAGDVLAGFVTGLLARGFAPARAAELAVYLHVDCALAAGPGLIAEDLPEHLPQVLRALLH
jgi:hydroxyethylthiazole kinase-like uncharacterized protein yjeF